MRPRVALGSPSCWKATRGTSHSTCLEVPRLRALGRPTSVESGASRGFGSSPTLHSELGPRFSLQSCCPDRGFEGLDSSPPHARVRLDAAREEPSRDGVLGGSSWLGTLR